MSHNHATRSKRMKLTLEEDIKGEKVIDNIRSVASWKGKDVAAKYYNFHINSMYTEFIEDVMEIYLDESELIIG